MTRERSTARRYRSRNPS